MKYARLTKQQFEELHQEFITFLATQSITAQEWEEIKTKKPEVAEEELDIFSDLVWEGVLQKAEYLENLAPQHMFLFKIEPTKINLIGVKVLDESKDITTAEGYAWLQQNFSKDQVEFYTASKDFSKDKHADIFKLVQQGAVITKGELYQFFQNILDTAASKNS
jgi:cag pathogenicity island protein 24